MVWLRCCALLRLGCGAMLWLRGCALLRLLCCPVLRLRNCGLSRARDCALLCSDYRTLLERCRCTPLRLLR